MRAKAPVSRAPATAATRGPQTPVTKRAPAQVGARAASVTRPALSKVARAKPVSKAAAKPVANTVAPRAAAPKPTLVKRLGVKPALARPALGKAVVVAPKLVTVRREKPSVPRPPITRTQKAVAPAASAGRAVPATQTTIRNALVRGSARNPVVARTAATRLVRIKALDPCARCGPNTSVEQLYRVDEHVAGTATVHLVFFDRHGWYCVHGASCVAVRDVHAELKAQRAGAGRRT